MGKWLAAIAKGLSYVAGPFKPIVDFVLKLYDGELAEKADEKIQKMIVEGQDLTLEILQILKEIKQEHTLLGNQLANGITPIIELINNEIMDVTTPGELKDKIIKTKLIESYLDIFWKHNFVCVDTIIKECCECWGRPSQIATFLTIVEDCGFNTADIPIGESATPYVQVSECIKQTFSPRYDKSQQTNIIGGLAKKAKASVILKIAHGLLLID